MLIEFWGDYRLMDLSRAPWAEQSRQKLVGNLTDAVRQSTKLDEHQKERMIEGIRASEIWGPQT